MGQPQGTDHLPRWKLTTSTGLWGIGSGGTQGEGRGEGRWMLTSLKDKFTNPLPSPGHICKVQVPQEGAQDMPPALSGCSHQCLNLPATLCGLL